MDTNRQLHYLFLIFILLNFLTGCTGLTVASTSAQAVYNRHELQQQLSDHYITLQAYRRIYDNTDRYDNTNLSITTLHNEVLLTGETPNPEQREEIIRIVKNIPNVIDVHCHITIAGTSSALTRVSDTWITTKIKSKFIAMNDLDATRIKVVTEDGTVYLMGIVLPDQADLAVEIAQNTQGVQSVIKHFSYMRISKT